MDYKKILLDYGFNPKNIGFTRLLKLLEIHKVEYEIKSSLSKLGKELNINNVAIINTIKSAAKESELKDLTFKRMINYIILYNENKY